MLTLYAPIQVRINDRMVQAVDVVFLVCVAIVISIIDVIEHLCTMYGSFRRCCPCRLKGFCGHIAINNRVMFFRAGCVYGGRLTAVLLPDETIVSVPAKRKYIEQLYVPAMYPCLTSDEPLLTIDMRSSEARRCIGLLSIDLVALNCCW